MILHSFINALDVESTGPKYYEWLNDSELYIYRRESYYRTEDEPRVTVPAVDLVD